LTQEGRGEVHDERFGLFRSVFGNLEDAFGRHGQKESRHVDGFRGLDNRPVLGLFEVADFEVICRRQISNQRSAIENMLSV
jgi:hypothetical protein